MLRLPQQNIAADRTLQPGFESSIAIEQHQTNAIVGTAMHQRRRNHDVAKANERAQMMQRHLELFLPLHIDANSVVFQMRVGIGCHDKERVEDLIHCVLQFVKFIASYWES